MPIASRAIKTLRRLADGREIIYYDSAPRPRTQVDTRDMEPADVGAELRFDPVQQTWVMYASHRQHRSYLPSADACPLCPSRPGHATEIPEPDYEVVVFENRFPALAPTGLEGAVEVGEIGANADHNGGGRGPVLYESREGAGRCEVVCYTAEHSSSLAELTPAHVSTLIDALVDRTVELGRRPDVEQVFCFENKGREIGVAQPHPHGQIYAYPFVPLRMQRALMSAADYRHETDRNLFDDILAEERSEGRRMVLATEHWSAFVPGAARWPFEVHCYPNERVPDLPSLGPEARAELPEVLLDIYQRFDVLFGSPAPYIAGWYQAPSKRRETDFALHLEMFTPRRTSDKLKFLAGSESGMDAFANDVVPEEAAKRLRQAGA